MLSDIQVLDELILFYFQSLHTEILNIFFWYVSAAWVFIPLWLWGLIKIYNEYDKKKYVSIILMISVTILASDQISNVFKNRVKRLRPTHNEMLMNKIKIVNNYRGGKLGFYSAHASNSAAICMLSLLLIKHSRLKYVMILYPFLSGISRIYLGVHYFTDILAGWIMGSIIALLMYKIFGYLMSVDKQ